jgi:hypothetical protein
MPGSALGCVIEFHVRYSRVILAQSGRYLDVFTPWTQTNYKHEVVWKMRTDKVRQYSTIKVDTIALCIKCL